MRIPSAPRYPSFGELLTSSLGVAHQPAQSVDRFVTESIKPAGKRPLSPPSFLGYFAAMTKSEVLTHPVRMRIVLTMVGGRDLTTADIAAEMPDVPIATLYRHIAVLSDGNVIDVVKERRVRGAVERTFRLRPNDQLRPNFALADRSEAAKMSSKDQRASFGVFAASMIAAYDGYLAREDCDAVTDPVGYRTVAVYADEADIKRIAETLDKATEPLTKEAEGKPRILISTVVMPA
jgi:DNA-binding transcriptional ArsR family regulator